jgi:hypothetical protein
VILSGVRGVRAPGCGAPLEKQFPILSNDGYSDSCKVYVDACHAPSLHTAHRPAYTVLGWWLLTW